MFANYSNYIGARTLSMFRELTGISVSMDYFSDNGDLFAKVRSDSGRYDLIVATSDWVARYIHAGYLLPLDWSRLPLVKKNAFKRFLDASFDPLRRYSVTYTWGTVGIGYRKSKVQSIPNSWKWLYDSDRYAGRIALQAACDELIDPAVIYLGEKVDTQDQTVYDRAYNMIRKQRHNVRLFASGNGQDILASGEVDLIVEQNGNICQVMEEDDDIGFVLPKEGGIIWQDNLCIPRDASNPDAAHDFINFIYNVETGLDLYQAVRFGTPSWACYQRMPRNYRDNTAIFPPEDELDRCQETSFIDEKLRRRRSELCLMSRL